VARPPDGPTGEFQFMKGLGMLGFLSSDFARLLSYGTFGENIFPNAVL